MGGKFSQGPPAGIWSYYSSSIVHSHRLEIDLFTDQTFIIRQAAGDSKTATKDYKILGSGTYKVDNDTVLFDLTNAMKKKLYATPGKEQFKGEPAKALKGTLSKSGKKMTIDHFGPNKEFKWRSPS